VSHPPIITELLCPTHLKKIQLAAGWEGGRGSIRSLSSLAFVVGTAGSGWAKNTTGFLSEFDCGCALSDLHLSHDADIHHPCAVAVVNTSHFGHDISSGFCCVHPGPFT